MSSDFFPFFILLLTAVLFSSIFSRTKVPWVVALIAGGILIGPNGFELFEPDATIDFLASIGLIFLMFMAGLESRFENVGHIKKQIAITAFLSGIIPALVGISIGLSFGYPPVTAILLGIIFLSSSIALLIPTFQSIGIIKSDFGKIIIGATILIDSISLISLSVFLQFTTGNGNILNLLLYPFVILLLVILAWIVPKIRKSFPEYAQEHDLFEKELRFILLILIGLVVVFEFVGLHAIIAAFFAGFILSKSIHSQITKAKLHAISYGLFIPLFFVVIGTNIDLSVFGEATGNIFLALAIVVGSFSSKFISGWFSGKIIGFSNSMSAFLGSSTIPSLSTTLAVAFLGFGEGLLTRELLTAIVMLTIVTSIVSPILVNFLSKYTKSEQTLLTSPALEEGISEEPKDNDS